jgi:hypothetical protein
VNVIRDIENDAESAVRDVRVAFPKLMQELGVNTENEHACLHAVLTWVIGEMAKIVQDSGTAAEIAKVL